MENENSAILKENKKLKVKCIFYDNYFCCYERLFVRGVSPLSDPFPATEYSITRQLSSPLTFVLCTVYCVLCTVYCVLCTVYCVLCTVYCVLCTPNVNGYDLFFRQ